MRRNITQVLLLSLFALCSSMSAQTQSFFHNKSVEERIAAFEKKKTTPSLATKVASKAANVMEVQAMKSPALRKAKVAKESKDVVLLDSVISDTRCEYYEYNDHGWLVSTKIYDWEEGKLQLDTEESFYLEYEFDDKDRLIHYSYYLYNADGSKGVEIERVTITWAGEKEHTEKYYSLSDGEHDFEALTLVEEMGYDQYGNPCLSKEYEWDSETETMELVNFVELKFTGCAVVFVGHDEDGEYEMEFDEELMQRYCYYYVRADEYDGLNAYKIDIVEDGLTTTKTRYTIELYSGDEYDLNKLDSYWEFAEEEVITLTPSRNRYASVYYYDRGYNADDNMPSIDNDYNEESYSTRSESEKVLDASYVFEWDEYERLVKMVNTDYEGDVETYTCSYHNEKYNVISLIDFETALFMHWEGMEEGKKCVMEGNFYGEVHKDRYESSYGYGERTNDEYDTNGNVLHRTYTEVYYSDEEAGKDLNGDGVMSSERETNNYEAWLNYDASGNITSYIEYCDTRDASRAYIKYVNVNEKSDDQYILGWREYEGASKEGSWTLTFEEIYIFNEDPASNPDIRAVGGWYRTYSHEEKRWYGSKWEEKNGTYIEYTIDPATGEFSTTGYAPATRSDEELVPGINQENFIENNWEYTIETMVDYVWDEETGEGELKMVYKRILIVWVGQPNGLYGIDSPSENYDFPIGPYKDYYLKSEEEMSVHIDWLILELDIETSEWITIDGAKSIVRTNYYTNEKGQIVNNYVTYVFDENSERMIALPDVNQTIYSFDAQNRPSTVEYNDYIIHYVYRNDECNYLLESYWIDKVSGAKYNVCKYYYSDGKYIYPYTDIEEGAVDEGWNLNGCTITADGGINLYNLNGQAVARGNGVAVAPQSGLYIVDVDGKRAKVLIR